MRHESDFLPEEISTDTTSTINTDAASSLHSDQHSAGENADGADLKDSLLAQILAQRLADDLTFDEVTAEWFVSRSGIWQPATKTRAARIIADALHELLPDGYSMAKLNSIEGFLKLYLALGQWERSNRYLPMRNGVLDVQSMELSNYTGKHKFCWQLPYSYDLDATMPTIKRWLWAATGEDLEVIKLLRAFMKISVANTGGLQKFLELVGPGGTGKSTFVRLLVSLLGESNTVTTDLKNLEVNRFETAALYGKRLAVVNDSSRYGGEVSTLKAITGGDPVRHEQKNRQQNNSFVFAGVVVIASNEPIQSTDYSSGLARRRLPVTFNRKVTDEDKAKWRDKGGIESAMQKELPGLLNWILSMPDSEVEMAISSINGSLTKAHRSHLCETNKLAAWIDDNLVIDEQSILYIGGNVAGMDAEDSRREVNEKLYPNYLQWCDQNRVQAIAVQRFRAAILDVAEHCKLAVKELSRDSRGKRVQGLRIRKICDIEKLTPITQESLKSDTQCISSVEGDTPGGRENVNSADNVDENLLSNIDTDVEVF